MGKGLRATHSRTRDTATPAALLLLTRSPYKSRHFHNTLMSTPTAALRVSCVGNKGMEARSRLPQVPSSTKNGH